MIKFNKFLIFFILPIFLVSCDFELTVEPTMTNECICDVSVVELDAPAAVISGQTIDIRCVIRNVVSTNVSTCTKSEVGEIEVIRAYSSSYKSNFSEYAVISQKTYTMDSYEVHEGQTDDMTMDTDQGSGFYAMKVVVKSSNDNNSSNDAKAVSIQAF